MNLSKKLCHLALLLPLIATPAVAATHPHLLFTAADVPGLQQKATSSPLAQAFLGAAQGALGGSASGPSTYGDPREAPDALLVLAFAAVLQHDAAHLARVRAELDAQVSWNDWLYGEGVDLSDAHFIWAVALTYDWLYADLSATERSSVQARLGTACDELDAATQGSGWWANELMQNHNWINASALGVCALALDGDLQASRTDGWLQTAVSDLTQVQQVLDGVSDGTWHEGTGYQAYGLSRLAPFLEMLRAAKGTDLTDIAMVRAAGTYRAANMIPSAPRTYLIDDGDTWGWDDEESLLVDLYAAHRFGDGVAQAAGLAWQNAAPLSTYLPDIAPEVFAFIFYDPSVAPADLSQQPLDARFTDLQATIFRSDHGANPLMLALKTGPFTGEASFARLIGAAPGPVGELNLGHDHADDNGLYLFANGQPLLPEAAGYNAGTGNGHPPAQMSRYHNTLLVDGAGQLGDDRTGDVVQEYAWANQRAGGISRGGSTADYAFAQGDAHAMYPAAMGLSRFDRQVLLVDRGFAVVRDVVDSASPHTYAQVWHFLDGASASGAWVKGVAKNGQLLGVNVVAPADFGFATSSLSPDNLQHLDPDGAVTEADVSTPGPSTRARMLSVLWPSSTADWSSLPTVAPLSATEGAGLVLTHGAHVDEVLLHDDSTESSTEGDLTVDGLGGAVATDQGALSHAMLLDGTRLARGGVTLIELPERATVELELEGSTLVVTGEGVNVFKAFAPGISSVVVNGHALAFAMQGETAVVPPPGVAPDDASVLSDPAHPTWRAFDAPSNPTWNGGGGWPTSGGTSGSTGSTRGSAGSTGGGVPTGTSSGGAWSTTGRVASGGGTSGGEGGSTDGSIAPSPGSTGAAEVQGGCASAGGFELGGLLWLLGIVGLRKRAHASRPAAVRRASSDFHD